MPGRKGILGATRDLVAALANATNFGETNYASMTVRKYE
jgi:hypothetical protein